MEKLSTQEILGAGLDDWRKLAQALHARYRIADFRAGAAFVAAVAEAAESAGHHPDLKMTGGSVIDDSQAPSFTVLADPDGNKVCVATCPERG